MRIVHKYGGSSVSTIEKIEDIAKHLKELHRNNTDIVVVVSAMGKTTNNLIELANKITMSPNKRELDSLLATGEIQTTVLLAMALHKIGESAISFSGAQAGIKTNSVFGKAFIEKMDTKRIKEELGLGKIVIVAGFQGISMCNSTTTLGRGGSDTTAVALAAALSCPCEIYTDVDCVYTCDPKIYPKSKPLHKISYEEMMQMSICGAKVLETRCVELAKKYRVPLYLGKSLETNKNKGTYIMNKDDLYFEQVQINGISLREDFSICTIKTKDKSAIVKIIDLISDSTLNLGYVSENSFGDSTIFSFGSSNSSINEVAKDIAKIKNVSMELTEKQTKVSLVGIGLSTHTGISKTLFETLMENDINFGKITTSELSISFTIDNKDKQKTIEILSKKFDL